MVDEDGDWEVDKDKDNLQPTAGLASRMLKVVVKVPVPKPVELTATVAAEVENAELKVA